MVELEPSAAGRSDAAFLDPVRSDDRVGVLSISVDGAAAATDGGAAIDVEELECSVRSSASELTEALGPTIVSSGGGAANHVSLDTTPSSHPLLQLIDVGRPAGVVLTCARSADLLDWRWGALRRIAHVRARMAFPYGERPGPVVTNTGPAERATPMRDQRARRDRAQFLEEVGAEAVRLAGERGWERIVIASEQELTRALADALPTRLRERTMLGPRHLTEIDGPLLAIAVAELLAGERAERNLALADHIREAATGGGRLRW